MAELMESVAGNLQQRIGELVSRYEVDMAVLRAQATKQLEDKDAVIKSQQERIDALESERAEEAVVSTQDKPARTRRSS